MCYPTQEIESRGCHDNRSSASPANTDTSTSIESLHQEKERCRPLKKRSLVHNNNEKACPVKKGRSSSSCKQSVRFSLHHNQIYEITSASRKEEIQSNWHTKEDLERIKDNAQIEVSTAALCLQLTKKEPDGFTGRGLELQISQKVRDQRKNWIETTVGGVLLVQALHKRVNLPPNPHLLQAISRAGSETPRKAAILLAALDAQEAKQSLR